MGKVRRVGKVRKVLGVRKARRVRKILGVRKVRRVPQVRRVRKVRIVRKVRRVRARTCTEDLPDELLLKVFSYLTTPDLIRISRVCHRWNRIAGDPSLWEHVNLTKCTMQPKTMWNLLCRYMAPHLQSLRLSGYIYEGQLTKQLLKSLMHDLSVKCPKLWRLSLHTTNLHSLPLSALPSSLRALELCNCRIAEDWLVPAHGMRLPHLESLVLKYISAFGDQQLKELGRLPSLRSLVLVANQRLSHQGLDNGLRELPDLQHFELLDCRVSTDRVLHLLRQHLTSLRSLRLRIWNLSLAGLKSLSTLPALESLSLMGPVKFNQILNPSRLLATFLLMPKLRTLNILEMDWAGNQEKTKEVLCKGLPLCKVTLSSLKADS